MKKFISVLKIILPSILIVILSCIVMFLFMRDSGVNKNRQATLDDMVYGKAWKPYVFRTLLPTTARVVSAGVSQSAKDDIELKKEDSAKLKTFSEWFRVKPGFLYEGIIVFVMMFVSLLGYGFTLFFLSRDVLKTEGLLSWLAPVLGLIVLPYFFLFGYIYDFPVLFLFSLSLYLMFKEKWTPYFIVFTLACLNKETTILIAFGYAAYFFKKLDMKKFLILGGIHVVLFGIVKGGLELAFAENPGVTMILTLKDQLKYLVTGYTWGDRFLFSLFLLLVFFGWRKKPEFLKKSLFIAVPLVGLFLLGSCPQEYRVFYEIFPILILLIVCTFIRVGTLISERIRA